MEFTTVVQRNVSPKCSKIYSVIYLCFTFRTTLNKIVKNAKIFRINMQIGLHTFQAFELLIWHRLFCIILNHRDI